MRLSDMSNEELWQLFPILLTAHQPVWKEAFAAESERLVRIIGQHHIARISHYGSTAVSGLIAKPTIDILLEINESCDTGALKGLLENNGYIFTAQPDNPPPHMMFLKGYTPRGFEGQTFHLHVRYLGDWDELYFRDYLIAHKDVADAYGQLKMRFKEQYRHDRDGYTAAKTTFIKAHTAAARQTFGSRYEHTDKP